MIDKRLMKSVPGSMKYILVNVLFQWIGFLANICFIFGIAMFFEGVIRGYMISQVLMLNLAIVIGAVLIRIICTHLSFYMSDLSSQSVKRILRDKMYHKLLEIGGSYGEKVSTAEIVQLFVEGVDQLEIYFGSYVPQFIYAFLAPITLFIVMSFLHWQTALVLLLGVPMIPISIVIVQKWAKKRLSKYWGNYTALGNLFLENLQAMTTLKIYQADQYQQEKMDEQAESFRKITMKVLMMQLNSISIMDLFAYGGTALGIILASIQLRTGNISLSGAIMIALLASEYFLPMRLLGSFFHIAMNGMAAGKKLFHFLDLQSDKTVDGKEYISGDITLQDVSFSYDAEREVLHRINMTMREGEFTAIVGESGSGKSTIASLLMKRRISYTGNIFTKAAELRGISEDSLYEHIVYIGANSHLFKGTVRDNLLIANPEATDEILWNMLEQCRIAEFFRTQEGLETQIQENAGNLSKGQAQRLAMARCLLKDADVYLFDEATSNIDVESEAYLMDVIHKIAEVKTVILISHRLLNVIKAKQIYVLDHGNVMEHGTHEALLNQQGVYEKLWLAQQSLENFDKEAK